ncbi:MAG: hypothetical protein CMP22_06185 [Rickettsiales bacterium]|nr:hypothetical protein [Rickettsiales bacterium]
MPKEMLTQTEDITIDSINEVIDRLTQISKPNTSEFRSEKYRYISNFNVSEDNISQLTDFINVISKDFAHMGEVHEVSEQDVTELLYNGLTTDLMSKTCTLRLISSLKEIEDKAKRANYFKVEIENLKKQEFDLEELIQKELRDIRSNRWEDQYSIRMGAVFGGTALSIVGLVLTSTLPAIGLAIVAAGCVTMFSSLFIPSITHKISKGSDLKKARKKAQNYIADEQKQTEETKQSLEILSKTSTELSERFATSMVNHHVIELAGILPDEKTKPIAPIREFSKVDLRF